MLNRHKGKKVKDTHNQTVQGTRYMKNDKLLIEMYYNVQCHEFMNRDQTLKYRSN